MLYRDGTLVKGKRFDSWRRVSGAVEAMRVYQMRSVDELMFLHTNAMQPDTELIYRLTDECFVPFTVGGGVRTVDDFSDLLRAGADSVVISTAAVETPDLISRAADRFGRQCVVVSVDYRDVVYTHSGTRRTDLDPVEWCHRVAELGAGEIVLQSIERDGMMAGYDLETLRQIDVDIPVVVSGGAGKAEDLCDAIDAGADACAVGALFLFTHVTPRDIKEYMADHGYEVRLL